MEPGIKAVAGVLVTFARKFLKWFLLFLWAAYRMIPLGQAQRQKVADFFYRHSPSFYYRMEFLIDRPPFDAEFYLKENPDVLASGMDPYEHYARHGKAEGRRPGVAPLLNDYTEWIRRYDTLTDEARASLRQQIKVFPSRPVISVVMPVYNTNPVWLKKETLKV